MQPVLTSCQFDCAVLVWQIHTSSSTTLSVPPPVKLCRRIPSATASSAAPGTGFIHPLPLRRLWLVPPLSALSATSDKLAPVTPISTHGRASHYAILIINLRLQITRVSPIEGSKSRFSFDPHRWHRLKFQVTASPTPARQPTNVLR